MKKQCLLGYDIGSSSVKASLIHAGSGKLVASSSSPSIEMKINSPKKGWAEQDPNIWWENLVLATKALLANINEEDFEIEAIGIAYQMHGLVLIDKNKELIYPSIIWCDSRAVDIGEEAFEKIGKEYCLKNYLNSPGNFTASKLKWVKDNEPDVYKRIYKILLPGDFIAMKLTGEVNTTITGLSEGILWDFKAANVSEKLIEYYGFKKEFIPEIKNSFETHGLLTKHTAKELGLKEDIKVSYRAGDQPNNAFSLNVLKPGEIAATAGTSGVVYGIIAENNYDKQSRINSFAHVNYSSAEKNKGVLLCINGTGILYSWLRNKVLGNSKTYEEMNKIASSVLPGSEGLVTLPYGNGAERSLANKDISSNIIGLNFNVHNDAHIIRSALEGIVCAFNYGIEIMKELGIAVRILKAGNANLFLSDVFCEAMANICNVEIEIYNTDGSHGAARGAGIATGVYKSFDDAFLNLKKIKTVHPNEELAGFYSSYYKDWKNMLQRFLLN